jgi:hypothetical protein
MWGSADFTDEAVKDTRVLAVAGKVRYRIDPAETPYPNEFTAMCARRLLTAAS